jgi:Putative transposase of IS4/5 family (DUF4096)
MWKPEHRRAAERRGLRYPSDLTDAEWALVEPMIPPAKRGGRRREVNVREVLNAIFYALDGLPMAGAAQGPAAEEHGAFVLHAVGLGRNVGARPGAPLSWIVLWASSMYYARARAGEVNHHVCEFQYGELLWISYIDRSRHIGRCVHEPA